MSASPLVLNHCSLMDCLVIINMKKYDKNRSIVDLDHKWKRMKTYLQQDLGWKIFNANDKYDHTIRLQSAEYSFLSIQAHHIPLLQAHGCIIWCTVDWHTIKRHEAL